MLKFSPQSRLTAAEALCHPYLEDGRLRYHTTLCSCCHTANGNMRMFCNGTYTEDQPYYVHTLVDLAEFTAKGVCSPNVSAAECCLLQLAYVCTYGIDLHNVHNGCSYSVTLSPFCSSSLSPPPNFPPLQTWSLLLPPSLTPNTRRT